MNEVALDQLSARRFAEFVGREFCITVDGARKTLLRLSEVTGLCEPGSDAPVSRYESFSLFFDGPADTVLPQRIYSFEHERIGRFDLFVVPVGNERGCRQYQVVFNRLRQDNHRQHES